mmetsp:Transcript_11147/g.23803  ORF Transcript_11147/g.23803 Transcript_11147/m.23803 type:complete len:430 (-) Transcript_11147:241-1530(-)
MKSTPPPPPADWPPQADQDYDRIRVLGAGAFGEVWLAKAKRPDENGSHSLVAIKGVSITNESEDATAMREMAILSDLNHPNIIHLLHDYEPASASAKGRYMALSYVNGPDLGELLEERGAVGLPLAQLIARDLISAVAYCHARGVMHRDIKPDNIMLEGCKEGKEWLFDDEMWGDKKIVKPGRFKAVLADFGFARATSAADYEQSKQEEEEGKRAKMNRMKSRYVFRAKSAVGTKHFAAPEITGTVRKKTESEQCLTSCVSSYALISDAYAVGATLSEITTGVPPGQDVETYVKENRKEVPKHMPKRQSDTHLRVKKSPLSMFKRMLHKKPSPHYSDSKSESRLRSHTSISSGSEPQTYDIQLRYMHELPEQAMDLITSMMEENMDDRLSVREAQDHEWIGGYDILPHGDVPSRHDDPIVYVRNERAFI